MIIAINQQPYDGPWGGGNRFLQSIVSALTRKGHQVVHYLSGQIDIILMVETRLRSPGVTFDAGGILRYLITHPQTLVVHRINECDERKGEKFITHKLLRANYAADLTVFVGSWLKDLPAWKEYPKHKSHVILNGADTNIFHANGFIPWNGQERLRLVTHHWGAHPNKGFDVYNHIDSLLGRSDFSERFSMTYIGKLPQNFAFQHIKHIAPLNGKELADALRQNHAYITGSINEPGGNHQNEGALCGLPILYRDSGCMPEYCDGFGLKYKGVEDVESSLQTLQTDYDEYLRKIKQYPHNSQKMSDEWCGYFEDIYRKRADILKARNIYRNIFLFLRNQIPI